MNDRHSGPSPRDRRLRLLGALGLALLLPACAASPAGPSTPTPASIAGNVQLCVDEINRYRATIGRPALTRSDALDQFATQAAQHDHVAGVPHLLFRNTNGGGVATAETELLHWTNYAVRDVIKEGLAGMWAVGPGGEHYNVLSAGTYTQVGCGVYVDGATVSVAQDFR